MRYRALIVAALGVSCGGSAPTAPPAPAILAPMIEWSPTVRGGVVTWEYAPGFVRPSFAPPLAWTARVIPPQPSLEAWIAVRLLDHRRAICFQSATNIGPVQAGKEYRGDGGNFSDPGTVPFWETPCGDDFGATAEVWLTDGAPFSDLGGAFGGQPARVLLNKTYPDAYEFTRMGYPGGSPNTTGPSAPPRSPCCRVCTTGKACGDTCIDASRTCSTPPGCACNG